MPAAPARAAEAATAARLRLFIRPDHMNAMDAVANIRAIATNMHNTAICLPFHSCMFAASGREYKQDQFESGMSRSHIFVAKARATGFWLSCIELMKEAISSAPVRCSAAIARSSSVKLRAIESRTNGSNEVIAILPPSDSCMHGCRSRLASPPA